MPGDMGATLVSTRRKNMDCACPALSIPRVKKDRRSQLPKKTVHRFRKQPEVARSGITAQNPDGAKPSAETANLRSRLFVELKKRKSSKHVERLMIGGEDPGSTPGASTMHQGPRPTVK